MSLSPERIFQRTKNITSQVGTPNEPRSYQASQERDLYRGREMLLVGTVATDHDTRFKQIEEIFDKLQPTVTSIRDSHFPGSSIIEEDHYRLNYPICSNPKDRGSISEYYRTWIVLGRTPLGMLGDALVIYVAGENPKLLGMPIPKIAPRYSIGVGYHAISEYSDDLSAGTPWDTRFRLANNEAMPNHRILRGDTTVTVGTLDSGSLISFERAGLAHSWDADEILGALDAPGRRVKYNPKDSSALEEAFAVILWTVETNRKNNWSDEGISCGLCKSADLVSYGCWRISGFCIISAAESRGYYD